ncbi:MAG: CYTH domain-containing protein [Caldilineaceae bacterium]|nr:CYTH domain-containing protein [Caldilineaceae bacterium]
MGQEIERKFLVTGDAWRCGECTTIRQGYLVTDKARTVRVRTKERAETGDTHAYLTIKGATSGAARAEYEYEIPLTDAQELLDQLCIRPLIEKHRYTLQHAEMTWEVDEFFGDNAGLIVAEIELDDADQSFAKPDWLGKEVTDDHRYFNAALTQHPYREWS